MVDILKYLKFPVVFVNVLLKESLEECLETHLNSYKYSKKNLMRNIQRNFSWGFYESSLNKFPNFLTNPSKTSSRCKSWRNYWRI